MNYTSSSFKTSKAKTKEFLTLLHDATMCLNEGIKCVITYQKSKTMVNRLISGSKAVFVNNRKRRQKLHIDNIYN